MGSDSTTVNRLPKLLTIFRQWILQPRKWGFSVLAGPDRQRFMPVACDDKGRCRKLCLFRSQSCRLTREALDLIFSDHFSRNEPGVFETLRDALLTHGYDMHLADLKPYIEADERLLPLYTNPSSGRARPC